MSRKVLRLSNEELWARTVVRGKRVDYFYGFRVGGRQSEEHGHLVMEKGRVFYDREVEGLVPRIFALPLEYYKYAKV